IDVDTLGNVFVADATQLVVHKYDRFGHWLYDFGGRGDALGQFRGDLRGLVVDRARGLVYVADTGAGQIEKFDLNGQPLGHFGSNGSGPGQLGDGPRAIDLDSSGNVLVPDYGSFRWMTFG